MRSARALLKLVLLLTVVSLHWAVLLPESQGLDKWPARYNGPGNGDDEARALAVDAQGNVYVTGHSAGVGSDDDYATIKYSPTGQRLWARRYNGPGNGEDHAYALAVDDEGNVYVTGESMGVSPPDPPYDRFDYATIKYSPTGERLWTRCYNGPGNGWDGANALALDAQGNVHVTGYSPGVGGSGYDYVTIKYSSSGALLWARRYSGPGTTNIPAALAVDAEGNVYVTGESMGIATNSDYLTIKYSPTGERLWAKRYNGPGEDGATALAVDAEGNAYVTGYSTGADSSFDYVTIKYGPSGVLLWAKRYSGWGNGRDAAHALAVDTQGNVYVTGESGDNADYATVKYSPAGDRLWVRRYNGPGNWPDTALAIALDAQGNVYVTGESLGIGTSAEWSEDYATLKYSPTGVQLWEQRYSAAGDGSDWARAIALDPQGNVYVTGESLGIGTGYDYATVRYSQE